MAPWPDMQESDEALVSVDIEASGPSPSTGSMLSIGACLVDDPAVGIYIEIKPLADRGWSNDAARVHGLDRQRLEANGIEPAGAMRLLADWLAEACGDRRPIFVGFNSPFDWMFVADYMWRYLGRNPFGISALDLKSYYMAGEGVARWDETRRLYVDERLGIASDHNHHALDDARGQAALARLLIERVARRTAQ